MEYVIDKDKAFIRLDPGADLFGSILQIADKEGWNCAHISAIGALTDVVIGYFNIDHKEYYKKAYPNSYELLSMDGNLTMHEGKRFLHLHGVLSDDNMQCFGGHFFKATVSVSCEINLRLFSANVTRVKNCNIGILQTNFSHHQIF